MYLHVKHEFFTSVSRYARHFFYHAQTLKYIIKIVYMTIVYSVHCAADVLFPIIVCFSREYIAAAPGNKIHSHIIRLQA